MKPPCEFCWLRYSSYCIGLKYVLIEIGEIKNRMA